jgi:hypothetical protein
MYRVTVTFAAVSVFILAAPPAAAQSLGAGNTTCAQFLRAARSGDILYHQASNWLLGYVSGRDAALKAARASTMNLTGDQIMKSAADYCEAHPAATIATAAAEWYPSLPKDAEVPSQSQPSRSWMLDLNARPSVPGGRRGP